MFFVNNSFFQYLNIIVLLQFLDVRFVSTSVILDDVQHVHLDRYKMCNAYYSYNLIHDYIISLTKLSYINYLIQHYFQSILFFKLYEIKDSTTFITKRL